MIAKTIQVPRKIGKYDVVREVGRGSMGVVYLAFDPYVNREVAIKVANAEQLNDPTYGNTYRKLFFNEAHTAGMLTHPNLLAVFDAGVEQDICYIIMEFIPGGETLKDYCRADNLLPVERVVEMIFKCAKALDYAHRKGVIHRDIKPSNILVTRDMDVRIADFSIAYMNRSDSDTSVTQPVGLMGSPLYMSPEQAKEEVLSNQTDLFSLGLVMYEMITGKHPFAAETFSGILNKIINQEAPPLSRFRAGVPEGLEAVMRKALDKELSRRYKNGLDWAADLSMAFNYLEQHHDTVSNKEKFLDVKGLEFFGDFPDNEIWEVINASLWQTHKEGDAIITEGEVDDTFYIIVGGEVVVTKGDTVIGTLKRGDCFGEMGYIMKTRRTANIRAIAPVTLMKVNSTLMEQASVNCQLRFHKVFLRTLIERLSRTTAQLGTVH
ncbi:protein kinase domain-containing protein [Endothiovibrio diazotrophicus]